MALDLEPSDIGVSWRAVGDKQAPAGVEIVLYDYAPGGAGFVKEAFDNWSIVTSSALKLCEQCSCERSCYDCLKSYGNQAHHDRLDRNSVIDVLKTS